MKTVVIILLIALMVGAMLSIASSILFPDDRSREGLKRKLRENTDLTKEQYTELCKLIREMDLSPKTEEITENAH